jgi:sporulation protein YlmC with PRC-barrel domain
VELNGDPAAFSSLIGLPVRDLNGRSLGRVYEARGHWEGDQIVIDELLVGRRGLLQRLRGPRMEPRGVPWANVVEVDRERLVVRG